MNLQEKDIKSVLYQLNERTKELNCVYEIDTILRHFDSEVDETINRLIEVIPNGFQFTDICKIKFIYKDKEWESEGFKRTELKITTPIIIDSQILGEIQIFYIKPVKLERKRIFLPEELKLLSTISEKFSDFINYKNLRASLTELKALKQNEDITKEDNLTEWLKSVHLNKSEIAKLCQTRIEFKKGETICKQGTLSSYVVLLIEGTVKSYIEGVQDKNYIFKVDRPFEFYGLSSLFGKDYYHFSVNALTNSSVYLINKEVFIDIFNTNQRFQRTVLSWFCDFHEQIFHRMSSLANKQALGRISDTLLYLHELFNQNEIPSHITRRDLAEMAGVSTENAVRILSELKNENTIEIVKSGVVINNAKRLKTFSIAG
ncbi:MAG TPA: hypothetical protein DDX39_04835 [Bacteroidales bacterium]|nr:MAG: hypothetical protein A2W98_00090 [Bacteroidetes bacterium GWF2_33_38]OFY74501.1 MAG: hypothetical protein A2265_08345 [Bacteroidetes bacterium RIFOXYA12_FULL_33_9]HBF87950.1 hypothetical protein [Bacteroidales bacterium]